MAIVVGRLQIRNWNDKEGNKRKTAEVVAENVYFGDSKNDSAQSNAPASNDYSANNFDMLEGEDSGLPF